MRIDQSPGTMAEVMPHLEHLIAATAGTADGAIARGLLAKAFRLTNRTEEAEALLRELVAQAAARGEIVAAVAGLSELANLLRDTGRPSKALEMLQQMAEYNKQAGRGAWTRLSDETRQLQIRNALDEHNDTLARVLQLRQQMRQMPDPPEADDTAVDVWNIREATLDVGRVAALMLEEWQQALELSLMPRLYR